MAIAKTTARRTKSSTTNKRPFTLDVDLDFLGDLVDSGSEDTRANWIKLENLLKNPRRVPADLIPELLERAHMVIMEYGCGDDIKKKTETMFNVAELLYNVCEWAGLTGELDLTQDPDIAEDERVIHEKRERREVNASKAA